MTETPTPPAWPEAEWIDASTRQPKEAVDVLINDWDYGLDIGWYDKRNQAWYSNRHEDAPPIELVTHWMPLPKTPC